MPALWWVELGLGPPVGRPMLRGASRGGCMFRKSLGSLFADWGWGWGAVFLPFWVFCLRLTITETYGLMGEARCWCL